MERLVSLVVLGLPRLLNIQEEVVQLGLVEEELEAYAQAASVLYQVFRVYNECTGVDLGTMAQPELD